MAVPKQRGAGQTGNTSHGHRSNRVNSTRRGGNPHAGGGGGGKGGICGLIVLGSLVGLGGLAAGVVELMS